MHYGNEASQHHKQVFQGSLNGIGKVHLILGLQDVRISCGCSGAVVQSYQKALGLKPPSPQNLCWITTPDYWTSICIYLRKHNTVSVTHSMWGTSGPNTMVITFKF